MLKRGKRERDPGKKVDTEQDLVRGEKLRKFVGIYVAMPIYLK